MTIRIPKPTLADRFLRLLGKRRAVQLPANMGRFGTHFNVIGDKESFWRALFRKSNKELPEEAIDIFMIEELKQYKNSNWGNDGSD